MTVVAHAADWLSLAFLVPVIAFIAWLLATQRRERRRERGQSAGSGSER